MVDKNESDSDESQNIEEDLSAEEDFDDDEEENDVESGEESDNEGKPVTKNGSNKRPIQISGSETGESKKKKLKKELYKPPTAEEMTHLRETENLFHSNLFRLEIEEMMKEIQVKEKHKKKFQSWFAEFHGFLMSQKKSKELPLTDFSWLKKHSIILPVSVDIKKFPGTFQFLKPSAVTVVGSFANNCCLSPNIKVDIRIDIPKETFVRADHQNQKYILKRALYLCHVASKLKSTLLCEEMEFSLLEGDPWRPVLIIKSAEKLGKHLQVHIFCAPEVESFKLAQLGPEKANFKPKWVTGKEDDELQLPTPHYNRCVGVDAVMAPNEQWKQECLESRKALMDGIMMLKVWLKQRGLGEGYGAFSGYIMTMYIAHLVKARKLSAVMSSYQVVRNTWHNLAREDWTANGISLAPKSSNPSIDDFHLLYEVVFVDCTGFVNLCGNMSKATFLHVKRESAIAIKCLDNFNINSFSALFMTKMPFYRQFDHIISFDQAAVEKAKKHFDAPARLDENGPWFTHQAIMSTLNHALDQRASLLSPQLQSAPSWSVVEQPPNPNEQSLVLGLALDPEHALALLSKGPSANLPEAKIFREFWGDRSELRRFQDGSVSEAVVWSGGGMARRRLICREIVLHVANRHMGLSAGDVLYIADQFQSVLENSSGEEGSLACTKACDELGRQLLQLQGLPLDIASCQGASPILRYSDPFPPLSYKALKSKMPSEVTALKTKDFSSVRYRATIPVIITLALSSKWPEDLDAVLRIKAAFYVKFAEILKEQLKLVSQPYPKHIDVYKGGFVFRLMVYHAREISLIKETATEQGLIKYKDNDESLALELKYLHKPKLTSALHGLHMTYPSLGPASCLAKRWVSSHLLLDDTLMPEMCVELLMASIYLTPEPFQTPVQPQTAFLRFLQLLHKAPWKSEPFILNFREELQRPEIVEIENKFNTERSTLPPLFIVTPETRSGTVWTKSAPNSQILFRLNQLATASLQTLDKELLSNENFDFKLIFRTPMNIFDVVINLRENCTRRDEALDAAAPEKSNLQFDSADRIPVVDLDFVQCFLKELRESYSDYALFFHDRHGGNQIGVLFKPNVLKPQEFKVSHMNGHTLKLPKQMQLSKEVFVEDVKTLGEGIVKSITMK